VTDPGKYGHHAAGAYETVTAGAVEPKVKAATGAGAGAALVVTPFLLWLIARLWFAGDTAGIPLEVTGMVGFVVTGLCSLAAGYYARHVNREPGARP
jgi:hypothetical protein